MPYFDTATLATWDAIYARRHAIVADIARAVTLHRAAAKRTIPPHAATPKPEAQPRSTPTRLAAATRHAHADLIGAAV